MSAMPKPRCGKRIRNWKICARPAGHNGGHASEEAWRRAIGHRTERRASGQQVVSTHSYAGYTQGCRCEVCTAAKAAYMRDKRNAAAAAARPGAAVTGVTHGTRSAYEEHGCRCRQCVAAERASSRWNREARAAA